MNNQALVELRDIVYMGYLEEIGGSWWTEYGADIDAVTRDYLLDYHPEVRWMSKHGQCTLLSEMDLVHIYYTICMLLRTIPDVHVGPARFKAWWLMWLVAEVQRRAADLAAAADGDYPLEPFGDYWRNILLCMRHTPWSSVELEYFLEDPVAYWGSNATRLPHCPTCSVRNTINLHTGTCKECHSKVDTVSRDIPLWDWRGLQLHLEEDT